MERSPVDTLRALQEASLETGLGESTQPLFSSNTMDAVKQHLLTQGYDIKHNGIEASLRAWQVRHGLHGHGTGKDGRPDAATLALMSVEMNSGGKAPLEVTQIEALDNLTRLANNNPPNGLGLGRVFEKAGGAKAAPAATEDRLGDFVKTLPGMKAEAPTETFNGIAPTVEAAGNKLRETADAVRTRAAELGSAAAESIGDGLKSLGSKLQQLSGTPAATAEAPQAPLPQQGGGLKMPKFDNQ